MSKEMIVDAVTEGLERFNMKRKTCLATDWSDSGIGLFLLQKYCLCEKEHPQCCKTGWKLVLAGGRVTNPAESRYSPIEGECLTIAEALPKAKHYVLGCNDLLLATDQKLLIGVFPKNLENIENPKLLSMAENMWFKFKTIHVPVKLNDGPYYMSRHSGKHIDTSPPPPGRRSADWGRDVNLQVY